MNNNVCIILLIFLIVYLIYKISSNSCDGFSVGSQTCRNYVDSCLHIGNNSDKCNKSWTKMSIGGANKKCSMSFFDICTMDTESCNDNCQCLPPSPSPPPPPPPPKIRLKPENPSQFLEDIKYAYNASDSNGVFVSMILQNGLDGSGSVVHKNKQSGVYGFDCLFGFIWDTNWLDENLVECLFLKDVISENFGSGDCIEPNFCELANTSGSNTPDRCSHGLIHYNNFYKKNKNILYPTNCNQNIKYDLDKMERVDLENSKNCYTYIEDSDQIINSNKIGFNEGVFLKDVKNSLNYYEGFEKLKELNKPLPVALLFLNNNLEYCKNDLLYLNILDELKSSFTSDTIVIYAYYDNQKVIISSFDSFTTLGKISR
jgi:hypothetical protein